MSWDMTNLKADEINTNKTRNDRVSTRSKKRGESTQKSYSPKNYDVIGIHGAKARGAAEMIVGSCDAINQKVEGILVNADILNKAVVGDDLQTAIKEYVETVKDYFQAVISDVKLFADKLYEVAKKWEDAQAKFAGNINNDKGTSFGGSTVTQAANTMAQGGGTGYSSVTAKFN